MRLTILGCHGGESLEHRLTTFLIDDDISIDAGALCRSLSLEQQMKIDHVILSHTHLDHVRDLAFLADNIIGFRTHTLMVHATPPTIDILRHHFFNDHIWPDFTRIHLPGQVRPAMAFVPYQEGTPFQIGRYSFLPTLVNHTVESMALIVSWESQGQTVSIGYSSDTGPTTRFWELLAQTPHLRALLCECSFTNDLQWLADDSLHLTPRTLLQSLRQVTLPDDLPILLYHAKPSHLSVIQQEVEALGDSRLRFLQLDEVLDLK